MGILLAHEFGHFVLAERMAFTRPALLPAGADTLIGTFGAVIRIKSPIRSRKALFDIGIAGPIAGFLVAVPVLLWGLALSKPMAIARVEFRAGVRISADLPSVSSAADAVHASATFR